MAAGSEPVAADVAGPVPGAGRRSAGDIRDGSVTDHRARCARVDRRRRSGRDAFYRPPAGFSALEAPRAVPNRWRVKADAPRRCNADSARTGARRSRICQRSCTTSQGSTTASSASTPASSPSIRRSAQVELKGSASPLPMPMAGGDELTRLTSFAPFDDRERNRQEHALYIGSDSAAEHQGAGADRHRGRRRRYRRSRLVLLGQARSAGARGLAPFESCAG